MPEITVTVENAAGLHARPAAVFVDAAKRFESDIKVVRGEKEANAKSILGIMSLGVEQGMSITIRADGPDADEALATLRKLVQADGAEVEGGGKT